MMHKAWCSIEEVHYCFPRSSIKFQGHKGKKSPISTRIERFRSVNSVWIHQWIWSDTQSLMQYRRGALLFFEVIHQISRSHGLKNRWFGSNLSQITRPVAAIKSLRFALLFMIWTKIKLMFRCSILLCPIHHRCLSVCEMSLCWKCENC